MPMPRWFRIVKHYPGFREGPTVPFLIGALRSDPDAVVSDEQSKQELGALISAMRSDMPPGHGVVLEQCSMLGTYVFKYRLGGSGLKCIGKYGHDIHDDQSLLETLWDDLGTTIRDRQFSLDPTTKSWRSFSAIERSGIKFALKQE